MPRKKKTKRISLDAERATWGAAHIVLAEFIDRHGFMEIFSELEREILSRALYRAQGIKTQAAIDLKLNRTTLVEKMRRLKMSFDRKHWS